MPATPSTPARVSNIAPSSLLAGYTSDARRLLNSGARVAGHATIDGIDCLRIEDASVHGITHILFVDARTYRPVLERMTGTNTRSELRFRSWQVLSPAPPHIDTSLTCDAYTPMRASSSASAPTTQPKYVCSTCCRVPQDNRPAPAQSYGRRNLPKTLPGSQPEDLVGTLPDPHARLRMRMSPPTGSGPGHASQADDGARSPGLPRRSRPTRWSSPPSGGIP